MSWFVFPEDRGTNSDVIQGEGDKDDAAAFAFALRHVARGTDYVATGWDVTIDTDDYEATIAPGTAVIGAPDAFAYQMQSTVGPVAFVVQTDASELVELTNNTENTIWAHLPLTANDSGEFVVTIPSDDPPAQPRLKIETVDLS